MGILNLTNRFKGSIQRLGLPIQLLVPMRFIPGVTYQQKYGAIKGVAVGSPNVEIWEGGVPYTYSDIGVADINSLSSSDPSDNQLVYLQGNLIDGTEASQLVQLNGRSRVPLSFPLWRMFRMENMSYPGQSFAGTVYCFSGTEVDSGGVPTGSSVIKAVVNDGNNQTQMAIYLVPKGKVGFLCRGESGFGFSGTPGSGAQQVEFCFKVRTFGNVMKVKKTVYCVSTGRPEHTDDRPLYDPIPALSDVAICIKSTTAAINAHATFHLFLVDEYLFPNYVLEKFLQPGYSSLVPDVPTV